jgi:hypothetical protein
MYSFWPMYMILSRCIDFSWYTDLSRAFDFSYVHFFNALLSLLAILTSGGATARDREASCISHTAWNYLSESSKSLLPVVVQLPETKRPPVHHIPLGIISQSPTSCSYQWWCNCQRQGGLLYITYRLELFVRVWQAVLTSLLGDCQRQGGLLYITYRLELFVRVWQVALTSGGATARDT